MADRAPGTARVMHPAPRPASFAELAARTVEGRDYRIRVQARRQSSVAVIAPHAGGIERDTSAVAVAIAGIDLNLYLFEGLLPTHNHERLHLTSHRFDEPRCLALIAGCDQVIAVHGCALTDARALLGGRDEGLKSALAAALRAAGIEVETEGHGFPGLHPDNICNRGRRGRGVQLELSDRLRDEDHRERVAWAVREALGLALG
jgi:phage replication-related protein YjqB (UPF0714/DUF867 family)